MSGKKTAIPYLKAALKFAGKVVPPSCLFALVYTLFIVDPSATYFADITITATGKKTALEAKSAEVWLLSPTIVELTNGKYRIYQSRNWEKHEGHFISRQHQPAELRWSGYFNPRDTLELLRHPWSGEVVIKVNSITKTISLFERNTAQEVIQLGDLFRKEDSSYVSIFLQYLSTFTKSVLLLMLFFGILLVASLSFSYEVEAKTVESAPSKERPGRLFWNLLILLMLVLTRYHAILHGYSDWDEPAMMSEAWAMTQGQVLYRDIHQIHPPFQFFLFIPYFTAFPNDLAALAIRITNFVLVYFGALMIRRIFWLECKDFLIANLSAILFIFYLGFWWATDSFGEFYTIFPILVTAYFILTKAQITNWIGFMIGLLWATAFYLKQISIFDAVPLCFTLLFLRSESSKTKIRNGLYVIAGFGIVTLVAFCYSLWHGTVQVTAESIFFRNVALYTSFNVQQSFFPALYQSLIEYRQAVTWVLDAFAASWVIRAVLYPLLVLGVSLLLIRSIGSITPSNKRILSCSVIWILMVCLGFQLIGRFYAHYLIQLVTPLVLFFCAILSEIGSRWKKLAIWIVISICFYSSIESFINKSGDDRKAFYLRQRSAEVAKYIREHTDKKDTIFVFNEFRTDIFYLSERLSPNGIYLYIDMDSTHTNNLPAERELRARLEKNRPTVIVWGTANYPKSSAVRFFTELVQESYELKQVIHKTKIYFLRDEIRPHESSRK